MALWAWQQPAKARYAFVVDLDQYAGNWEREVGAYCIGRYDEYGGHRAGPYAVLFEQEMTGTLFYAGAGELSEERMHDPGDEGRFLSPVELAPTPGGREFNSVAIFLSRKPTAEELQILNQRARAFEHVAMPKRVPKGQPKVLGCRLVAERTVLEETKIE